MRLLVLLLLLILLFFLLLFFLLLLLQLLFELASQLDIGPGIAVAGVALQGATVVLDGRVEMDNGGRRVGSPLLQGTAEETVTKVVSGPGGHTGIGCIERGVEQLAGPFQVTFTVEGDAAVIGQRGGVGAAVQLLQRCQALGNLTVVNQTAGLVECAGFFDGLLSGGCGRKQAGATQCENRHQETGGVHAATPCAAFSGCREDAEYCPAGVTAAGRSGRLDRWGQNTLARQVARASPTNHW